MVREAIKKEKICDIAHNAHEQQNTHAHQHQHACDGHGHISCCSDHPALSSITSEGSILDKIIPAGFERSKWHIAAMDCPVEENMIRKKLLSTNQALDMEFNLIQRTLIAIHPNGVQHQIIDSISELGMEATPIKSDETDNYVPDTQKQKQTLILASVGLLLALLAEFVHYLNYPLFFSALPSLIAITLCGLNTYKKGWIAIRHGELNINALMSVAVTGAVLIGQWPEAAMVMALFTISELIEEHSLDRARQAISNLLQLAPDSMTVQQDDGSWLEVSPSKVTIGSMARVRPGQRIALDGVITHGYTSIDQSSVTGESLPVDKRPGDMVYAGTMNTSGEFEFQVTSTTKNSTLARIIHAVENAQSERAPTQRFIDQFARYYTPAVVCIAFFAAILPPLLLSSPWLDSIYKALVILVIACPCALVISTPVTIVSGLTSATKHGLLIKGGVYLENARHLRWLALDKTGTITHGKPMLTELHILSSTENNTEIDTEIIGASIASRSDHPVSVAIANAAKDKGIRLIEVDGFEAVPGQGTRAKVLGRIYQLGNLSMTEKKVPIAAGTQKMIINMEAKGQTVVMLSSDEAVLALFAVSDMIKPESQQAIRELHGLGVQTLMLSGDNELTAQLVAKQAGIDEAHGDMLPEDKLKVIARKKEELRNHDQKAIIGMVGDGINDAPALATADIGIAMGLMGTDTAMETADIAIMDDDLRKIPELVKLSKRTHSLLIQNISLALGIKALFLLLTLAGLGTMWMAVFADVGTSLLVVFNGLRILRP